MTTLLDHALAAHGGLDHWNSLSGLVVRGSLGGPFWAAKGWADVYRDQTITIDTRAVDIAFAPYPESGHRSRFTAQPEHLAITDSTGAVLHERNDPRATFPPTDAPHEWDAIQTAYFTSCAVWNYLTAPFVFTYPGVEVDEIEPWVEDGETWRRLAVRFPAHLPNHNRDQTFYFDDAFLLRRLDYHPDVTDAAIAHYTYDHRVFDGIVFPTRRVIHPRRPDGTAVKTYAPITLQFDRVVAVPVGAISP